MKKLMMLAVSALLVSGIAFANTDKGKKKKCAKGKTCCQKKTSCNKSAEKTVEVKN